MLWCAPKTRHPSCSHKPCHMLTWIKHQETHSWGVWWLYRKPIRWQVLHMVPPSPSDRCLKQTVMVWRHVGWEKKSGKEVQTQGQRDDGYWNRTSKWEGMERSKRQVLGLILAVYHINEGSCSIEPGDNNQSFGVQICLNFLASASHPHNFTVSHASLPASICSANVLCFISSHLTCSLKGEVFFLHQSVLLKTCFHFGYHDHHGLVVYF